MKEKLKVVFYAAIIGTILSILVLMNVETSFNKEPTVLTIFQVGSYSHLENAKNVLKEYEDAVIYQENERFLVLVGAAMEEKSVEKIEQLLIASEIHYYKKQIEMNIDKKDAIKKYDDLVMKTENKDIVRLLNRKILKKVETI